MKDERQATRGALRPPMLLAIHPEGGVPDMPGERTEEPAFGLPALWVEERQRDEALARINEAIRQAAERLKKLGFQTHAPTAAAGETKLLVRRGPIQVKVEVNFVMRGTVQPVRPTGSVQWPQAKPSGSATDIGASSSIDPGPC